MIIVPIDSLNQETLTNLVEEFVTRDGTDYGFKEASLESKVSSVLKQLQSKQVFIVFDEALETTSIVTKDQLSEIQINSEKGFS